MNSDNLKRADKINKILVNLSRQIEQAEKMVEETERGEGFYISQRTVATGFSVGKIFNEDDEHEKEFYTKVAKKTLKELLKIRKKYLAIVDTL